MRQSDMVLPLIAADRDRVSAPVIGTVDHQAANA
jgi:hypothetical protein